MRYLFRILVAVSDAETASRWPLLLLTELKRAFDPHGRRGRREEREREGETGEREGQLLGLSVQRPRRESLAVNIPPSKTASAN